MKTVIIDGNQLTLEDLVKVSREGYRVSLSNEAVSKINKSRKHVDQIVEEEKTVYGITTGFGKFSDVFITKGKSETLQHNLIVSHACAVGEPLDEEIVRAIMLLRANALSVGYSGIRLQTLNTLLEMLNKGVHPIIPEKGSLGASGDLAPLAHMVLVLLGKGEAIYQSERLSGKEAMKRADIPLVQLTSKEGLALINGTQVMTAIGALTLFDAIQLSKTADIIGAMTVEALRGIVDAFDPKVHRVRPHKGQMDTAENLLKLLQGSHRTSRQGDIRVQDAYTLRCLPQIHGATKDAIGFIEDKVLIEMNAVTDNPLIFPEENEVISGGNFHGQPMALPFDFLAIGLSELANASERRIERLVNPALSQLPGFLVEKGGLNSGFMIVQYSAASLVSENKVLAHPASVDSIPSSANQEDHVSMGTIAARKAREVLGNVQSVLAMELLTVCQAIDLGEDLALGQGTQAAYNVVRQSVEKIEEDKVMYEMINTCQEIIKTGLVLEAVEKSIGSLKA